MKTDKIEHAALMECREVIAKGREALQILTDYLNQISIANEIINEKEIEKMNININHAEENSNMNIVQQVVNSNHNDRSIDQIPSSTKPPPELIDDDFKNNCSTAIKDSSQPPFELIIEDDLKKNDKEIIESINANSNIYGDVRAVNWVTILQHSQSYQANKAHQHTEPTIKMESTAIQCDTNSVESTIFMIKLKTRIIEFCNKNKKSCRHICKYFSRYDIHKRGYISIESFYQLCSVRLRFQLTSSEMTHLRMWSYSSYPDLIEYRPILVLCFGEDDVSKYLHLASIPTSTENNTSTESHTQGSHLIVFKSNSIQSAKSGHKTSVVDKLLLSKYSALTDVCLKSTARHIVPQSPSAVQRRACFRRSFQSKFVSPSYNSTKRAVISDFALRKILMEELVTGTTFNGNAHGNNSNPPTCNEIILNNILIK